tara:strand:- start:874 stop:1239 length:366 start_codon:yes stop_codon:yes gene_type:complete
MEAAGSLPVEIADEIGIHRATVYRWREIPAYTHLVAALLADTQRAARATLRAGARTAAARVLALVESEDERIALSAAQTLLDRTGHPKAERVEVSAEVEASARVEVDPSEALAALLAGGQE